MGSSTACSAVVSEIALRETILATPKKNKKRGGEKENEGDNTPLPGNKFPDD